jgi:putative aldouronate transport system permease protein
MWFNEIFLILLAILCLLPLIHVFALSLSNKSAAAAGYVKLLPVQATFESYLYVFYREAFWRAFTVTILRVATGGVINLVLTVLTAYPLSKESSRFPGRTVYVWIFFFSMLFYGGLIPTYMLISKLKMLDTIWALVLPGAVPVFSVVLMLNFFRQVPIELEEAALIDGANHFTTVFLIYIPVSLPSIATILLFSVVGHWNSWFDGLIYANFPKNYPLQSYLQTVVVMRDLTRLTADEWKNLSQISDRTVKAAQIFMGALPILCVYPFLQRYFIKGIVVGSVKG